MNYTEFQEFLIFSSPTYMPGGAEFCATLSDHDKKKLINWAAQEDGKQYKEGWVYRSHFVETLFKYNIHNNAGDNFTAAQFLFKANVPFVHISRYLPSLIGLNRDNKEFFFKSIIDLFHHYHDFKTLLYSVFFKEFLSLDVSKNAKAQAAKKRLSTNLEEYKNLLKSHVGFAFPDGKELCANLSDKDKKKLLHWAYSEDFPHNSQYVPGKDYLLIRLIREFKIHHKNNEISTNSADDGECGAQFLFEANMPYSYIKPYLSNLIGENIEKNLTFLLSIIRTVHDYSYFSDLFKLDLSQPISVENCINAIIDGQSLLEHALCAGNHEAVWCLATYQNKEVTEKILDKIFKFSPILSILILKSFAASAKIDENNTLLVQAFEQIDDADLQRILLDAISSKDIEFIKLSDQYLGPPHHKSVYIKNAFLSINRHADNILMLAFDWGDINFLEIVKKYLDDNIIRMIAGTTFYHPSQITSPVMEEFMMYSDATNFEGMLFFRNLLLYCAQIREKKQYDFNPVVLDTLDESNEFEQYLRIIKTLKDLRYNSKFAALNIIHWGCGEIDIDEKGHIRLLFLDATAGSNLAILDTVNKVFKPNEITVYIDPTFRQSSKHECGWFAIDDLKNLFTMGNFISGYNNVFDYLDAHPYDFQVMEQLQDEKYMAVDFNEYYAKNIRLCHLPLRMMRTMQKTQVKNPPNRSEQECLQVVNKKGYHYRTSVLEHFPYHEPYNTRMKHKIRQSVRSTRDFILKFDCAADVIEEKMNYFTLESFAKRLNTYKNQAQYNKAPKKTLCFSWNLNNNEVTEDFSDNSHASCYNVCIKKIKSE